MITKETIFAEIAKTTDRQPCVKQAVYALIITKDGKRYAGGNWIDSKISVCPRTKESYKTGEGYHLCREVCNQHAHAEVSAIKTAKEQGADLAGSTLYLVGHSYCCESCLRAISSAEIAQVIIIQ